VYTDAASLTPTDTYIFAHKFFHFKELGAKWRNILKHYFKTVDVTGCREYGSGAGSHKRKGIYPAKQVTSVSRWAVFH
jgi:peptide methionine sulfoxide reductase MsrA